MGQATRWIGVTLSVLAVSAAYQQDTTPKTTDPDAVMVGALREVINHGADVYNSGDHAGCYRIFEGTLMVTQPMLAHRADLQKTISTALTAAREDPIVWRRAFTLRAAMDKVRAGLRAKDKADPRAGEKLPPPNREDQKPDDKKPSEQKKPDAPKAELLPPPFIENDQSGEK